MTNQLQDDISNNPLHNLLTYTTTAPDIAAGDLSSEPGANLSLMWRPADAGSVSDRARVVLSQPVAILGLALSLFTLVANLLSIAATLLGPSALTTHLKLVVSLGVSDILLGLGSLSHLFNRIFQSAPDPTATPDQRLSFACASTFQFALNTLAVLISLLNLLAMAVDHYVAIMNPLHHHTRLSRAHGTLVICVIWAVAFLGGCSVFFADVREFWRVSRHLNYCEYVQYSDYQSEYLVFAVAFVTFFVITYTYGRIYVEVRRTSRGGTMGRLDYTRNRKAMLTTLLIIGTFVFCWLPTCLFQLALLIQVHVDKATVQRLYATFLRANRYLNALLLLNSLCDPVIYACRLRHVQLGYRRLCRACFSKPHSKRLASFPSSLRQTMVPHLAPANSVSSGGGHARPDNRLNSVSSEGGPARPDLAPTNRLHSTSRGGPVKPDLEDDVAELTPMITYPSSTRCSDKDMGCHHQHQQQQGHCQRVAGRASEDRVVSGHRCSRTPAGGLCGVCNVIASEESTSRV